MTTIIRCERCGLGGGVCRECAPDGHSSDGEWHAGPADGCDECAGQAQEREAERHPRQHHRCVSITTPDGHGAYCRICGDTLA